MLSIILYCLVFINIFLNINLCYALAPKSMLCENSKEIMLRSEILKIRDAAMQINYKDLSRQIVAMDFQTNPKKAAESLVDKLFLVIDDVFAEVEAKKQQFSLEFDPFVHPNEHPDFYNRARCVVFGRFFKDLERVEKVKKVIGLLKEMGVLFNCKEKIIFKFSFFFTLIFVSEEESQELKHYVSEAIVNIQDSIEVGAAEVSPQFIESVKQASEQNVGQLKKAYDAAKLFLKTKEEEEIGVFTESTGAIIEAGEEDDIVKYAERRLRGLKDEGLISLLIEDLVSPFLSIKLFAVNSLQGCKNEKVLDLLLNFLLDENSNEDFRDAIMNILKLNILDRTDRNRENNFRIKSLDYMIFAFLHAKGSNIGDKIEDILINILIDKNEDDISNEEVKFITEEIKIKIINIFENNQSRKIVAVLGKLLNDGSPAIKDRVSSIFFKFPTKEVVCLILENFLKQEDADKIKSLKILQKFIDTPMPVLQTRQKAKESITIMLSQGNLSQNNVKNMFAFFALDEDKGIRYCALIVLGKLNMDPKNEVHFAVLVANLFSIPDMGRKILITMEKMLAASRLSDEFVEIKKLLLARNSGEFKMEDLLEKFLNHSSPWIRYAAVLTILEEFSKQQNFLDKVISRLSNPKEEEREEDITVRQCIINKCVEGLTNGESTAKFCFATALKKCANEPVLVDCLIKAASSENNSETTRIAALKSLQGMMNLLVVRRAVGAIASNDNEKESLVRDVARKIRRNSITFSSHPSVRKIVFDERGKFKEFLPTESETEGFEEIKRIENYSVVKDVNPNSTYEVTWQQFGEAKYIYVHDDLLKDVERINNFDREHIALMLGLRAEDPLFLKIREMLQTNKAGSRLLDLELKEEVYEANHNLSKPFIIEGQVNLGRIRDEMESSLAACNGMTKAEAYLFWKVKEEFINLKKERLGILGQEIPLELIPIFEADRRIMEMYKNLFLHMQSHGLESISTEIVFDSVDVNKEVAPELSPSEIVAISKRNAYMA